MSVTQICVRIQDVLVIHKLNVQLKAVAHVIHSFIMEALVKILCVLVSTLFSLAFGIYCFVSAK